MPDELIQKYCREPGVRSLQKYTSKIIEKICYEIVQASLSAPRPQTSIDSPVQENADQKTQQVEVPNHQVASENKI